VGAADHLDVACLVELREYVRAFAIICLFVFLPWSESSDFLCAKLSLRLCSATDFLLGLTAGIQNKFSAQKFPLNSMKKQQ
jgi:hypothetical protein